MSDDLALEGALANAAVWGPPDQAAAMVPELRSAEVVDPWCRAVLDAVADASPLVDPTPGAMAMAVHERLVAQGIDDFARLVLADVEPGTLHALPFLLGRLDEAQERRKLRARLVALADTLERPGGPARVAEVIGMAS